MPPFCHIDIYGNINVLTDLSNLIRSLLASNLEKFQMVIHWESPLDACFGSNYLDTKSPFFFNLTHTIVSRDRKIRNFTNFSNIFYLFLETFKYQVTEQSTPKLIRTLYYCFNYEY